MGWVEGFLMEGLGRSAHAERGTTPNSKGDGLVNRFLKISHEDLTL
jgi:hypothetical protein